MLQNPVVLVVLLAAVGAVIGLLTGILVKRARLNTTISYRSLAMLALDNSPDLAWINHKGTTLWQSLSCDGVLSRNSTKKIDLAGLGLSEDDFDGTEPVRGVAQVSGQDCYFTVTKKQIDLLTLYSASPAQEVVKAEAELQRFMQTLTDTFAHLPIGLAIFDKSRQLVLFNPALAEQFDLSPEWLIRRPDLRSFLDRLRNDGKLPEPKDFKSWRDQIEVLERSAETGTYQDDWHLPDGQVFRVIGRPHPKNSVAFLFENISQTVGIEREYRSELERMLNVFDSLSSANVIFDASGQAHFCNQAFADLWGREATERLSGLTTTEMSRIWQEKCEPTPVWGDFRDFTADFGSHSHWTAIVNLLDGTPLWANFSPISGGQILCEFTELEKTQIPATLRLKHSA